MLWVTVKQYSLIIDVKNYGLKALMTAQLTASVAEAPELGGQPRRRVPDMKQLSEIPGMEPACPLRTTPR